MNEIEGTVTIIGLCLGFILGIVYVVSIALN